MKNTQKVNSESQPMSEKADIVAKEMSDRLWWKNQRLN